MKTFARFTLVEDAYLLRSFLGSHGIPASILDEHVPQLFWNYSDLIGGVRVVLDSREDLPAARAAYQEYRSALAQAPARVSEFRCWPLVLAISLIAGVVVPVFGKRMIAETADDDAVKTPVL